MTVSTKKMVVHGFTQKVGIMTKVLSLICFLMLSGCATYRTGIVHDHMIAQMLKDCDNHGGPHYVVQHVEVNTLRKDKPCSGSYVISCQDGAKIVIDDGVSFCFISESQIEESLKVLK